MNNRQQQIIEFAKENQSFKNKNLVVFFNDEYSRETITRDLSFLCKQKILNKSGAGAFVVYTLSEAYEILKEIDVKKYFSMPSSNRDVKPLFNKKIINLLNKNIFNKEETERLEKAKNRYNKSVRPLKKESPTIFRKEWERLIIDLSWKSSEIEGNTYTLLETEVLIKDFAFAKGKNKTEAQMILNHKKALDYILLNPDYLKKINIAKIKEIHKLLVEDIGIKIDFRNHPVGITGTIYRPLPKSNEIESAIKALINKMEKIGNPFVRAFVFLIMLAYIQPFEDGNKRTSRIIANAILHSNEIPMLSYRNVEAIEYKKAMLLFYEQNNINYIKKIFIEQMEFSANNYFK